MDNNLTLILKRIGAFFIDQIYLSAPIIIMAFILLLSGHDIDFIHTSFGMIVFLTNLFIILILNFIFDGFFEGQSLGKKLLNIQVIDKNDNPCSYLKSFIRNVSMNLPYIPIIEFFFVLIQSEGRRIGDYIAGTKVEFYNFSKMDTTADDQFKISPETEARIKNHYILFSSIFVFLLILNLSLAVQIIIADPFEPHEDYKNQILITIPDNTSEEEIISTIDIINERINLFGYRANFDIIDIQNNSENKVYNGEDIEDNSEDIEDNSKDIEDNSKDIEYKQISIMVSDQLIADQELINKIVKPGKLSVKIGNKEAYSSEGGIDSVCKKVDCSFASDPRRPCGLNQDGNYYCYYSFSVTITDEAAENQAQITKDLSIISNNFSGSYQYLNESLYLYIDDELLDTLKIGSELKGIAQKDMAISGSGSGATIDIAIHESSKNMKLLQAYLSTKPLPVKPVKVEFNKIS